MEELLLIIKLLLSNHCIREEFVEGNLLYMSASNQLRKEADRVDACEVGITKLKAFIVKHDGENLKSR